MLSRLFFLCRNTHSESGLDKFIPLWADGSGKIQMLDCIEHQPSPLYLPSLCWFLSVMLVFCLFSLFCFVFEEGFTSESLTVLIP